MKRNRKRPLTLLEVGIAIFLTGILLSFLWGLYDRWNRILFDLQKEKHLLLQKVLFQEKFSKLFSRLCPQNTKEKRERIFYTAYIDGDAGEGLVFSYDGGVDPNPAYSGALLGGLYVTPYKDLCMVSWDKEEMARKEILIEKVSSFSFAFFDEKKEEWKNSWDKKNEKPPTMIKIKVTTLEDSQEMVYSFFISDTTDPIVYEAK